MRVRRFEKTDAEEVSALIVTTLRETNIKDYSAEYMENEDYLKGGLVELC